MLFKAFGRTIHHLLRVRENYFGNFTNFSTRSEYVDKRLRGLVGDPVLIKYRKGKVGLVYWILDNSMTHFISPQ